MQWLHKWERLETHNRGLVKSGEGWKDKSQSVKVNETERQERQNDEKECEETITGL